MSSTETAVAAATTNLRPISTCPRCRSVEVEAMKPIPNASFREAAEVAWGECWAGRKRLGVRHLARWACVEAANLTTRGTLRCAYCGYRWESRS